jgi:hypothetical protein
VEGSHRASSRSIQILTMRKSLRLISIYLPSPATDLSQNKKPTSNSKQKDSQLIVRTN